jgi:hypothetical protein
MRRVGSETATTKPQREPMLKRIALTAVIVATAAIGGIGVAKAHSGTAKVSGVSGTVTPQGICGIPGGRC